MDAMDCPAYPARNPNEARSAEGRGMVAAEDVGPDERSEAARLLSRLLEDPEPLGYGEALDAVTALGRIYPAGWEPYLDDVARFRLAWNKENDLFTSVVPSVSLEESVYKSWTSDKAHPFHGLRGYSWGDPAAHMLEVLKDFGLSPEPMSDRPPDHLAVLLEFLAFLLEKRAWKDARNFCMDHLDWLPELRNAALQGSTAQVAVLMVDTVQALVRTVVSWEPEGNDHDG